jgi:hypothetical protein
MMPDGQGCRVKRDEGIPIWVGKVGRLHCPDCGDHLHFVMPRLTRLDSRTLVPAYNWDFPNVSKSVKGEGRETRCTCCGWVGYAKRLAIPKAMHMRMHRGKGEEMW